MRLEGRIALVTGGAGSAVYSAAEAGVIGFARAVARGSLRFGVPVNAVSPGRSRRRAEAHRLRRAVGGVSLRSEP